MMIGTAFFFLNVAGANNTYVAGNGGIGIPAIFSCMFVADSYVCVCLFQPVHQHSQSGFHCHCA